MRRLLLWLALGLPLLLAACATPPEVKQLSLAQIGYFDTAIEAVKLQSEALIIAAEKIKEQAEARIVETEQKNLSRLQKLVVETIPSQPQSERESTAEQMLKQATQTRLDAMSACAKLSNDLAAIKAKTQELQAYIVKMKEVQVTLDAYLQSERAGEQVLKVTLKQPTVESLLGSVNELLPKVTGAINNVKTLLGGLDTGG